MVDAALPRQPVSQPGVDVPTYVYRCDDNGHQFEVFQSMSDEPVAVCEVCGGPVTRLLFAPAIHFKGKGFHNTDYGTKRRPVGGDGDGGSGGADGGSAKESSGASGGDGGTTTGSSSSGGDSGSGGSSGKTVGLDKV